jgi:hypothetical protein
MTFDYSNFNMKVDKDYTFQYVGYLSSLTWSKIDAEILLITGINYMGQRGTFLVYNANTSNVLIINNSSNA